MQEVVVVPAERAGLELDEFLGLWFPGWSKGFIRHQVRAGAVLLDGESTHPRKRLRADQVLILNIDDEGLPEAPPLPSTELELLREEADWVVANKPAGLPVEPDRWEPEGVSLRGFLAAHSGAGGEPERLRIVHRLDRETSGALVLARTLEAERWLREAFDTGAVEKSYLAIVEGEHPLADGESELIDAPIGTTPRRSGRMRVDERHGKPARTRVAVEQRFRGYTLLRCELLTGRTHQIRVHLAHAGFPLAVDGTYGRRDALALSALKADYRPKRGREERPLIQRLTLHAERVRLRPPGAERTVTVTAPWPKDFSIVIKQLAKHRRLRP